MEKIIIFLKTTPSLYFFAASLVAVLVGDFFAKSWSENLKWQFFAIAAVGYLVSGIFYMPTLLKDGLIITAMIWMLLNIIGFFIIGFFYFKETVTLFQGIGIALGIIAITILLWPQKI